MQDPNIRTRLARRAQVQGAIRQYFLDTNAVEVDTPVAIRAPAPEAFIECPPVALHTDMRGGKGEPTPSYLRASPELCMKRLLAGGSGSIFQIGPVFRDGDFSPQHRPEFRLLEWYRVGEWEQLFCDAEAIIRQTARAIDLGDHWQLGERNVTLPTAAFKRISVDAAFVRYAGFSVLEYSPVDSAGLKTQCTRLGIKTDPTDSWSDVYHRIFLNVVEPMLLRHDEPFFLTHYPAPLAALAQLSTTDPRVAERTELYMGGIELANGFAELTDPVEQRKRFMAEDHRRKMNTLPRYPMPEGFLRDLQQMPQSCGMALGVERLLMVLFNAIDIDHINPIPWQSP